jgi:trehalose/maltose hydrolase-like predicted phosphorylase
VSPDERFPVDPWALRETSLDLGQLARSESLLALSNGHIGLRANFDEGEPYGIPGTYLNSFYEQRPLPYAEAGYGYPESGQTVVDVTNGKLIRLLVDDTPFDVRYGTLHTHERTLDFRTGLLSRTADWTSPAGARVLVESRRLVSFVQRSIAAIEYVVTAKDNPVRIVLQSELVANESQPVLTSDPRKAAALDRPLEPVSHDVDGHGVLLMHRTRSSGLMMAAGMAHEIQTPARHQIDLDVREDWARTTVICSLQAGQSLRLVKFVGYGWSALRTETAIRDQVAAALDAASFSGWDGLLAGQKQRLDDYWDTADVQIEGNDALQQAIRFGLFHIFQAGIRAEGRAIPSKGLTGPGYDGHTFWDTEGFVLPVLTYTVPSAAADTLRWRHSTLPLAKERAEVLKLEGAAFPWRTIHGEECSGYWPAGTAAMHIGADIAYAVARHWAATGDEEFLDTYGLDLLVETARLWMSVGHFEADGSWHIAGVTGPDEYSAIADDNVFTNLMAARNLRAAADLIELRAPDGTHRTPSPARVPESGASSLAGSSAATVTAEERALWRRAAEKVFVPYDDRLGVHPQAMNFTSHDEWDFEAWRDQYPLLMHAPYFDLYRKQVVKQADLVLAMHWCPEAFTPEQRARNVDYYERITVRDSSLSACTQAVLAAWVGHTDLAYAYTCEAAFVDLHDLHSNTADGLHMASLGGAWSALVQGFGGLREHDGELSLDPALPDALSRLSFTVQWRDMRMTADISRDSVTYSVRGPEGQALRMRHDSQEISLTPEAPLTMPIVKRLPLLPAPTQPPGREPLSPESA